MDITFSRLEKEDTEGIRQMSRLATAIVREHYDPIIGPEQNDYMLKKYQSAEAIERQISEGSMYYFVCADAEPVGFISIVPDESEMYLDKFYLRKDMRGKGIAHHMLEHIISQTEKAGFDRIMLNVNKNNPSVGVYEKLGFINEESVKQDIGGGFYKDDYIFRYYL